MSVDLDTPEGCLAHLNKLERAFADRPDVLVMIRDRAAKLIRDALTVLGGEVALLVDDYEDAEAMLSLAIANTAALRCELHATLLLAKSAAAMEQLAASEVAR